MTAAHGWIPECDPAELERAWQNVAAIFGSTACENPESGEVWQYMGTALHSLGYEPPARWAHEFRHRDLPPTGGRRVHLVAASDGWQP